MNWLILLTTKNCVWANLVDYQRLWANLLDYQRLSGLILLATKYSRIILLTTNVAEFSRVVIAEDHCTKPPTPANGVLDTCTDNYTYLSVCRSRCLPNFHLPADGVTSFKCVHANTASGGGVRWDNTPTDCVGKNAMIALRTNVEVTRQLYAVE